MKINIGVLGFAGIAQKAIIPALKENNLFHLKCIATSSKHKIAEIQRKYSSIEVEDYDALIHNKDIQALYIPLPNALHFEWIKKALYANKHVLCEKSLACSYAEVEELTSLARQKKITLVENFQFRKHSQLQVIKNLIDNNQIGNLRTIRTSFCFPPFADKNNIRYQKDLGGGALLDAGAYPLKLASIFLGSQLSIADASLHFEKNEVDIWGNGTLYNHALIPLQFTFGFDQQYQCNLEIIGSKGKISTDRIYTAPPNNEVSIQIQRNQDIEVIKVAPMNAYQAMLQHFYVCIQSEELQEVEHQQNLLQAQLLESFKHKAKVQN